MDTLKIGLSLAVVSVCALPAVSQAQDDSVRLHFGAGLGLGSEVTNEAEDAPEGEDAEVEADLATTYGVHAGVEVPVHQFITLGGELGLAFWNLEDRADPPEGFEEGDRQLQLDVLFRPKARFSPVEGLELYGVVPVGFTYYVPSSDLDGETEAGVEVDFKGGAGFAIGVGAGASYFITEHFGVTGELGYLYRKFNDNAEVSFGDMSETVESKSSFGQFQLRAGVAVAF